MVKAIINSIASIAFPQNCHIYGTSVESLENGVACDSCWSRTRHFSADSALCVKCSHPLDELANRQSASCHRCTEQHYDRRAKSHDWSEYAPTLSALAQPFYQAPPTFTQPRFGWQAQLVLSVPFYDGCLRGGLHAERDAIAASAKANYEGAVRQAKSDVREAGSSIEQTDVALASANRSAKLARTALDLVTTGFEGATLTSLDVIDAERRARDADVEVVIAEDAARQARIDLLVASGRLP